MYNQENEHIFLSLKENHQIVYDVFMRVLEFAEFPQIKEHHGFIVNSESNIFNEGRVKKLNQLNNEYFRKFLLSTLRITKEYNLANSKEAIDKVPQPIDDCLDDIRWEYTKNLLTSWIKSKIPGRDLMKSIPFLKKYFDQEKNEDHALSDEQYAIKFLFNILVAICMFAVGMIFLNSGAAFLGAELAGTIAVVMCIFSCIAFVVSVGKTVKGLCDNKNQDFSYGDINEKDEEKFLTVGVREIYTPSEKHCSTGLEDCKEEKLLPIQEKKAGLS